MTSLPKNPMPGFAPTRQLGSPGERGIGMV
jgi:hypothetical protein